MASSDAQAQGARPSLDDYSTFQYMLARPSTVQAVVGQIASVVFYGEPRDERKAEAEHKLLLRGRVSVFNYYLCCLPVLPSHLLGLSAWISVEERRAPTEETRKGAAGPSSGAILRRFRYSYYGGLLSVETHHVGCDEEGTFRLVEYFDGAASPWAVTHTVLGLAAAILGQCLRAFGFEVPVSATIAASVVLFHLVLHLTGAKVWG